MFASQSGCKMRAAADEVIGPGLDVSGQHASDRAGPGHAHLTLSLSLATEDTLILSRPQVGKTHICWPQRYRILDLAMS